MTTAPFFVMGCRRSGTTLVSQILDSHSRLAAYHESYFYPIFRPELRWYGDLRNRRALHRLIADVREVLCMQGADPPPVDALIAAMPAATLDGLLTSVLHLFATSRGKARGGDKTPEHYVFLDELLERFAESPVLFLMRDPRDVILSIKKTFGVKLEDGARSWNQAFLSQRQTRRPVHLVRYEELARSPASGVEAICSFMGEAFEPDMLSFFERIPERFRNRPGSGRLERPVNAGSVGRFREMSASDIARIELLCGEGMEAMGYPFAGSRPAYQPAHAETPVARPFLARALERLRYYGVNGERWRRGIARWRLMLRVRMHYLIGLGLGRAQHSGD